MAAMRLLNPAAKATPRPERFQGLELRCHTWQVEPLAVRFVESSYFDDRAIFPEGSVTFDCALLMRGIEHEWHGRGRMLGGETRPERVR